MNKNKLKLIKNAVFLLALLPLVRLIILAVQDDLSANPIEFIERSTGTWALVYLLITLSVTPMKQLWNIAWVIALRRMLGLWMFFYACLHIVTYVWLDYSFSWVDISKDIIKHPFVLVGFAAFVLTVPLAVTSNNAMINKLKSKWKKLHQLVYVIAILGVIHFWWLVKKDITEPALYAFALTLLLSFRINAVWMARKKTQVYSTQVRSS